jgi:Lon protease-like protein
MARRQPARRLPLFPLPDLVHFPHTELRLHVFEPRYRQLVRDLERRDAGARWIGMVLLKPGWDDVEDDPRPGIFHAGTAGRLVAVDHLPDGRSNIVLRGEFRFEVEREVDGRPYREALVHPLAEAEPDEDDPEVVTARRDLLALLARLAAEMGERLPIGTAEIAELGAGHRFVELINRVAAELDLPALRKLQLLARPLDERAGELLGILRSRQRVLDLLRPFRRLASQPDVN